MARTLTNYASFAYAKEESIGVLPATPEWTKLQPNDIGQWGDTYSQVSRSPISTERQRLKGTITKVESGVEFEADLTMESFYDFLAGFVMANLVGGTKFGPRESNTIASITAGAPGTGCYVVSAGGALAAGTLIYVRGATNAINNGLKVVRTGSDATHIYIDTDTLVAEASPPDNMIIEVCGFRTAAGDLDVDADGNLTSTVLDFTDLPLTVGQVIWVGGVETANRFATAANRGFARVKIIAANKLTIDKKATTFVAESQATLLIDLYFGKFARNVPVTDSDFLEQYFQFEGLWSDLQEPSGTGDEYEYAKGNLANEMSFRIPQTDKATINFGFMGQSTGAPTTTRDAEADTAIDPLRVTAFNTSADVMRLRITDVDEGGITTDFSEATLVLRNNAGREYVVGQVGAKYINVGNLEADLEATVLFTNSEVLKAIAENRTVTLDFAIRNEDGAIFVDIPACTLGDGTKSLPRNETVKVKIVAAAHKDTTLGTSLGISLFPYAPAA